MVLLSAIAVLLCSVCYSTGENVNDLHLESKWMKPILSQRYACMCEFVLDYSEWFYLITQSKYQDFEDYEIRD